MNRCQATTLQGTQCKKTAVQGTHYCSIHSKKVSTSPKSPKAQAVQRRNAKSDRHISARKSKVRTGADSYNMTLVLMPMVNGEYPYDPDKNGNREKALEIVRHTLFFLEKYIKYIKFGKTNKMSRYHHVVANISGPKKEIMKELKEIGFEGKTQKDVVAFFTDYYGEGAADTWMEGDIHITENDELFLEFERLYFGSVKF